MTRWREWLKVRWELRGSVQSPMSTGALPGTEQHHEMTDEQKFRSEHGYSAATKPMAWGEDIAKHNLAIDVEYATEIVARQEAYRAGTYQPHFLATATMSDHRLEQLINHEDKPSVDEVNWHLEMTARPGARVDVTKEPGVPMQPILSDVEHFEARMAGSLGREVEALEHGAERPVFKTPRDFIGSREAILAVVGGDEGLADQIEASARKTFGVEDLDAPMVKTGTQGMTPVEQAFDTAVEGLRAEDGYLVDKDGKIVGMID